MLPEDLKVEVRGGSLSRLGALSPGDYTLRATIPANAVGEWTLTMPVDHWLAGHATAPGAGLIVTDMRNNTVIFSGPMTEHELAYNIDTPNGELEITGVTDEVILADALAWPQPSNSNSMTQATATDQRSGSAENLLHLFVSANIGPTASTARKNPRLTMGANGQGGPTVTMAARWEVLLELLQTIVNGRRIYFRVVQYGKTLRFESYRPGTTPTLNLRIDNNQLASARIIRKASSITRAYVGGASGGVSRSFVERSSPTSLLAEKAWGRRIEVFIDQRSGTQAQLELAGDQRLAEDTEAGVSAQFEPNEDIAESYGSQWKLGDLSRLTLDGNEYLSPIASAVLIVDDEGVRIGATVGNASVFVSEADMARSITQMASRVSYLETAY